MTDFTKQKLESCLYYYNLFFQEVISRVLPQATITAFECKLFCMRKYILSGKYWYAKEN
jgi:hypothetical protein